jgi:hypothetical protein
MTDNFLNQSLPWLSMVQNDIIRSRAARHGVGQVTVRYGTILNPYFNRTVSDFLKHQHGTTRNDTETIHDTTQHKI